MRGRRGASNRTEAEQASSVILSTTLGRGSAANRTGDGLLLFPSRDIDCNTDSNSNCNTGSYIMHSDTQRNPDGNAERDPRTSRKSVHVHHCSKSGSKNLGRGGTANITLDYLGILSDPEYMAGVKEKVGLITALTS